MTLSSARAGMTPGRICFGAFSVFCLALILRNTDTAVEYMTRGLLLCARTVIPSLFPFMVLSELLTSGGFAAALIKYPAAPLRKLFRLSDAGCSAVILGLLCGFPVGAKCAVLSYDRGEMSKSECECVLAFSGVPSAAFLIGAVGTSLWGSRRFGAALYLTVLLAALLTGLLVCRIRRPEERAPEILTDERRTYLSGARLFTASIRSATESILLVSAYVVFFSALVGTLSHAADVIRLPEPARAILFCLTELSGGMSHAASLSDTTAASLLCAFTAGWSGMSVHFQLLSVADGRGLSFRRYFFAKLLQGLLCAVLFGAILYFFLALKIPAEEMTNVWMYLI